MPSWGEVLDEINGQRQPTALDTVRRKYLKKLHKKTGRNIIAYYSGWLSANLGHPALSINDEDKNAFMSAVHKLDRKKGLDLFLHTPGGGVAATESLVHYLREMFDGDIRAVIPQIAMSAGTMIAFACRSILMGKQSNLGAIDPQLGGIPAHGVISEFEKVRKEINQNPQNQIVWHPILSKYNPTFLGECHNAISLSNKLVKDWLCTGMFDGEAEYGESMADNIVNYFASHDETLTHSRHIHMNECEKYGLKIEKLEDDDDLQDLVLTVHHAFIHAIHNGGILKIVENHNGEALIINSPPEFHRIRAQ